MLLSIYKEDKVTYLEILSIIILFQFLHFQSKKKIAEILKVWEKAIEKQNTTS